jgi:phage shock protein PspC (stress-responsive transcriptional regulator)
MAARRLKRSVKDRTLFGVAGGLTEYFDIDPVIVRVGLKFYPLYEKCAELGVPVLFHGAADQGRVLKLA